MDKPQTAKVNSGERNDQLSMINKNAEEFATEPSKHQGNTSKRIKEDDTISD